MARIPLGNAGNRMPGRVPTPAIAESGVAVGRALENLGGVGVEVGLQKERDRLAVQWEEDDKQKRAAEAARKAKDAAQVGAIEDSLRIETDSIGREVLGGSIPKEEAEKVATERLRKVVDSSLPTISDESRPLVQPQIERHFQAMLGGVRKAKEQRDRRDVTTAFDQILEAESRNYARDPAGATARVQATAAALLPFSDYAADDGARKVQTWKESAQFNVALAAVGAGMNNPKALQNAEALIQTLPDLDQKAKVELQNRILNIKVEHERREAAAAQRAEAAEAARYRRAEAASKSGQELAAIGLLDQTHGDKLLRDMAGTPFAASFSAMLENQRKTGPLVSQSPSNLRATLDTLNARLVSAATPELKDERDRVQRVLDAQESTLKKDGGLRAGVRFGWITEDEAAPIDMAGGLPALAKQLRTRVNASAKVSARTGRPESPLMPDEAETLKQRMDTMPAKDRSTFIAAVSKAIGPQASAGLAQQLDGRDKALSLAFGYAGSQTTNGRFTSELILKGQQAKGDGTSTKGEKAPDVKAAGWKAYAAAELDGVFGNAQTTGQIRDAAELIMHGMASEAGGRLSRDDMERAVRLAVGGSLLEHNGRKIPLPAGVDADMLDKRLRTLTPADIKAPGGVVRAAGVEVPVADFLKTLPGQQLMPVRPGQYAVIVNGRPVVMGNGEPVIVGVR